MKRILIRSLAIALVGSGLAFSGTAPFTVPAIARPTTAPVPFTSAEVTRTENGHGYVVRWRSAQTGEVKVLSGGKIVATDGPQGSATLASGETPRAWFTLVPRRGSPLVLADRALHFATAPNFRDIGGYRTKDGRWVRQGIAYRSDQLDRLSDDDLQGIAALRPAVVADLRTATERTREPDRLPGGTRHLVLDVAADSTESLGGDMRLAMARIASGEGQALLVAANREFVTLPSARRSYAALVRQMIGPQDGPVIFHCTAGKDRTGWATAIVLTLLGVPRDVVMADYLQSNSMLAAKNRASMAALKASGSPLDPAFLEPVLTVRPAYIEAAFDEADRAFGSFDGYVRSGLGLDDSEIALLKRRFLTAHRNAGR